MDKWKGMVAVVTGASAGIGAAIVEALVKEGMIVVGIARRKEKIDEIAMKINDKCEGKLYARKADITKEEDILNVFDWVINNHGGVHVLINNAGISRVTTLRDGNTQLWRDIIDTNVMGLCVSSREAIRIMKERNVNGHIIHINSTAGHFIPSEPYSVYTASKRAITALTETLRMELLAVKSRIKITAISPGLVDTEIFEATNIGSGGIIPKEHLEQFRLRNPALRAEDLADAVVYVLGTPSHVQVHHLIIRPVGEKL